MAERLFNKFRQRVEDWIQLHIRVDEDELRKIDLNTGTGSAGVVRFESTFLRAILRTRFEQCGIPFDEFISLRERSGDEWLLGLLGKRKEIRGRSLERLSRANSRFERFVSITLLAGSGPRPVPLQIPVSADFRFFPLGELWTAAAILWHRNALSLRIGSPIERENKDGAGGLFRKLSLTLYGHEKSARGAKPQAGKQVVRTVLSDSRVRSKIRAIAVRDGLSVTEGENLAAKHLREIAGSLSSLSVHLMRLFLRPLFERIFSRIEIDNADRLKQLSALHPIVLLPCHRSHCDYLLISYALDRSGLSLPFIAAGDNLNFFPIGRLLRSCGGFFIRRTIEADALYKLVLQSYLTYLVKSGQTIEFYIEGGRSRTGTMLEPKLGLLKYLVQSLLAGSRRDLLLVPVGISYERVPEDRTLVREKLGVPKVRESFWRLLKLSRVWRMRFGSVSISFGEPVSLRSFVSEAGFNATSTFKSEDVGALTAKLGHRMRAEIAQCVPLQLTHFISLVFAAARNEPLSAESVIERVSELLTCIADDEDRLALSDSLRAALFAPEPAVASQLVRSAAADLIRTDADGKYSFDPSDLAFERILYYARPALDCVMELKSHSESKESAEVCSRYANLLGPVR